MNPDPMMWVDRQGRSISTEEAGKLLADPAYKIVNQEYVHHPPHHWWISTVWLGFSFDGTPFETMVWASDEKGAHKEVNEDFQVRYRTEVAAEIGHVALVNVLTRHGTTEIHDDVLEQEVALVTKAWGEMLKRGDPGTFARYLKGLEGGDGEHPPQGG